MTARNRCRARGCNKSNKGEFMCYSHARRLPRPIQYDLTFEALLDGIRKPQVAAVGAICILEHGQCTEEEIEALVSYGFNEPALRRGLLLNL